MISPGKNLWHCMGACQAGGSVIDCPMRREGVSFPHAVELLRDGVAPTPVNGRRVVRSTVTRLASPLPAGANDRELLERFRLGYANRTLGYRLPAKNRKAGEELVFGGARGYRVGDD